MSIFRVPPSDYAEDRAKLFARAPSKIYFGHISSFAVLTYLAWDILPTYVLVIWAAWEGLGTPILLHKLTRNVGKSPMTEDELSAWQGKLHGLFAVVGVSWGLFVALGLDIHNPAHFSIQMAIVAGASAAAARSLGIFQFSFYFYEIPFAGFLAVRIFMLGGDYIMLGVLVVIFMGMLCRLANDISEELSEYLATKVENLDLARKYQLTAQRADDANLAKTQFLTQANHDLRQPIHAIGLLSACLRDQPLDQEGERILDTIDTSVENLSKLFKSLLNLSSLETGALTPEENVFALDEVIQQVVRQAQPEAMQHHTELTFVKTSLWVKTDKALLGSILQNVVFNAVNYSRGKRVLIGVKTHNGQPAIHVLDQGIGIPKVLQTQIFSEFIRGNPDGPNRVEGLGLGLAIVARTAKLLKLDVDLASIEGHGTHVTLSALNVVQKTFTLDPRSTLTVVPDARNLTVVIVDDNQQILTGLQTLLTKWGYSAEAKTPQTFRMPPKAPNLLIIDLHLNIEKNGLDMAAGISEHFATRIPTLVISGTLTPEIEVQAKDMGYWVLLKPVSAHVLRSSLLAMNARKTDGT
jgi:signal transduction histidine kinase/CheY-like chemotaxis protein